MTGRWQAIVEDPFTVACEAKVLPDWKVSGLRDPRRERRQS